MNVIVIKIKSYYTLYNFIKQCIAVTIDWQVFHKIEKIIAIKIFYATTFIIIKSSFNESVFYIGLSTAPFKMLIK